MRRLAFQILIPALVGGIAGVGGTLLVGGRVDHDDPVGQPMLRSISVPVLYRAEVHPSRDDTGDARARRSHTDHVVAAEQTDEPAQTREERIAARYEEQVRPFYTEQRDYHWATTSERSLRSSFEEYATRVGISPDLLHSLECRDTRCLARLRLPDGARPAEGFRRDVANRLAFGYDPDCGNCPLHAQPADESGLWTVVFDCEHRRRQE